MDRRVFLLAGSTALSACMSTGLPRLNGSAPGPGNGDWKTLSPGDVHLSRERLEKATQALGHKNERQGVVVVHQGRIVHEAYWDTPFAKGTPEWKNVSFSSGKSWGATMVGVAVHQNYLSVDDLASAYHTAEVSGLHPDTRISHLLTMTSGGTLNTKPSSTPPRRLDDPTPAGPGAEYEWHETQEEGKPEGYGQTIKPGEQFIYDGAPADHLANIVTNAVGKSSHRFMIEDVARPLGCRNFSYQPEGVDLQDNIRIGGSLLISCRDMARLGQLYLNGGRWGKQRLLDESFVKDATTPSELNRGYGYLWWLNADGRIKDAPSSMFYAAGARGQYCYVLPDHDMVISTMGFGAQTLGTDESWSILRTILPA